MPGFQKNKNNFEIEQVGGLAGPDFKMYYKATASETVWFWHKRYTAIFRKKIESSEINLTFTVSLFPTMVSRQFNGQRKAFSTIGSRIVEYPHIKE